MKVVIDTNVVVSAILRDRIPEEVILFVVRHPDFEWVASPAIMTEYLGVLRRPKFRLPEPLLQQWQSLFERAVTLVDVDADVAFSRDRNDAAFLACALATEAEYLVTGDRDFAEAYKVVRTTILSAAQFKALVSSRW